MINLSNQIKSEQMFLAIVLSTLFATLFGCWYLPHTLALRYFLMYSGSLGGLFIIWKSHSLVKAHSSLPILLIILLVVWVTCHLIWIGHDHVLQLAEFFTIWKKIIISNSSKMFAKNTFCIRLCP